MTTPDPARLPSSPVAAAAAQPFTLLLVDDEAHVVTSLARMLRRDGYQILTANSADEGLALLAANAVDVVLSDQRMPGKKGTEFLAMVRDRHPNTVRLILSGAAEIQDITRGDGDRRHLQVPHEADRSGAAAGERRRSVLACRVAACDRYGRRCGSRSRHGPSDAQLPQEESFRASSRMRVATAAPCACS